MATEEEHRHEHQAVYGYLGQANAGIGHSNKRGAGASVPTLLRTREKLMAEEEAQQEEERELNNRAWGKEEVADLHKAVEE